MLAVYMFRENTDENPANDNVTRLVLAWVNDLRHEHALGDPLTRLPPGRLRDAEHCVVARAVHLGHCVVEGDTLTLHSRTDEFGDSWITGLPRFVIAFLEALDAGQYPLLARY